MLTSVLLLFVNDCYPIDPLVDKYAFQDINSPTPIEPKIPLCVLTV